MTQAHPTTGATVDPECPVSLERLGEVYRADDYDLPYILEEIPALTRAKLAAYLYGKSHMHQLGLKVARACERDDPLAAPGRHLDLRRRLSGLQPGLAVDHRADFAHRLDQVVPLAGAGHLIGSVIYGQSRLKPAQAAPEVEVPAGRGKGGQAAPPKKVSGGWAAGNGIAAQSKLRPLAAEPPRLILTFFGGAACPPLPRLCAPFPSPAMRRCGAS
jgi:hypothetical protein